MAAHGTASQSTRGILHLSLGYNLWIHTLIIHVDKWPWACLLTRCLVGISKVTSDFPSVASEWDWWVWSSQTQRGSGDRRVLLRYSRRPIERCLTLSAHVSSSCRERWLVLGLSVFDWGHVSLNTRHRRKAGCLLWNRSFSPCCSENHLALWASLTLYRMVSFTTRCCASARTLVLLWLGVILDHHSYQTFLHKSMPQFWRCFAQRYNRD